MYFILKPVTYLFIVFSITITTGFSQLTWTSQISGSSTQFIDDVCFIDANRGWTTMAPNIVLRTNDGGDVWTQQIVTGLGAVSLTSIYFVNSVVGFLLDNNATIYKSLDGGLTWTPKYTNSTAPASFDIYFIDQQNGWVSRTDYLLFTDDGGDTWDSIPNPLSTSAMEIEFVNATVGYIMGTTNDIAVTNNGGQNWDVKSISGATTINGMSAPSETTVYVCAGGGKVFKSTNSGDTWVLQSTSISNNLFGINFFNETHGIAVGDFGKIVTTTNGGSNWIINTAPTTSSLFCVDMVAPNIAWITGSAGTILHTESGSTDLQIELYLGPDSACASELVDVPISVKNIGVSEIYSGTFTVKNSLGSIVLLYPWTGSILPNEFENIMLGQIFVEFTDDYTIKFLGDSVTLNNVYGFHLNVKDDASISTNDPITICPGDSAQLVITGGESYQWVSMGPADTLSSITVTPNVDSYYLVYIGYADYCQKLDTLFVLMATDCGSYTNLAFSPNGDGINDYLHIEGAEDFANKVTIYDRWGSEINFFNNYNNADIIWLGDDVNGKSLVEGTYFYIIENGGVLVNGVHVEKAGWVQLVK